MNQIPVHHLLVPTETYSRTTFRGKQKNNYIVSILGTVVVNWALNAWPTPQRFIMQMSSTSWHDLESEQVTFFFLYWTLWPYRHCSQSIAGGHGLDTTALASFKHCNSTTSQLLSVWTSGLDCCSCGRTCPLSALTTFKLPVWVKFSCSFEVYFWWRDNSNSCPEAPGEH